MTSPRPIQLPIEKHMQSLMMVIVIGVMSWVGITIERLQVGQSTVSIDVASIRAQVAGIEDSIQRIRNNQDNGYTRRDAEKDKTEMFRTIGTIEKRIDQLENKCGEGK